MVDSHLTLEIEWFRFQIQMTSYLPSLSCWSPCLGYTLAQQYQHLPPCTVCGYQRHTRLKALSTMPGPDKQSTHIRIIIIQHTDTTHSAKHLMFHWPPTHHVQVFTFSHLCASPESQTWGRVPRNSEPVKYVSCSPMQDRQSLFSA